MKICDECQTPQPNVGPWQDGRQLCGSCKVKITFSRPEAKARFEASLRAVMGVLAEEAEREEEQGS